LIAITKVRGGGSFNGLPIGNLTSQLFANLYLNELDIFAKHTLKIKRYIRYSDDFIVIHHSREYLEGLVLIIKDFIEKKLKMSLHPKKIILRKFSQGIDFLGYIVLPQHIVLRTKTKQRMFRKIMEKRFKYSDGMISKKSFNQTLFSYFGILKHCNGRGLRWQIKKIITFQI
jgi:RNA-directed DNA polymerase